jgi:hypothetical protein
MNFSKTTHKLGLLALFFATAFFTCSSVGAGKLGTIAPLVHAGPVVVLQADGGAPPPPPPSTKLRPSSATLA